MDVSVLSSVDYGDEMKMQKHHIPRSGSGNFTCFDVRFSIHSSLLLMYVAAYRSLPLTLALKINADSLYRKSRKVREHRDQGISE